MAAFELTPEAHQQLTGQESQVNRLQNVINKLGKAGFDVSQLQQNLDVTNARRQGLIREFAPGQGVQ